MFLFMKKKKNKLFNLRVCKKLRIEIERMLEFVYCEHSLCGYKFFCTLFPLKFIFSVLGRLCVYTSIWRAQKRAL